MANQLPISIAMGALPANVRWTPQQLADAIAQRLRLVTSGTYALFAAGSTEPASDVGPWFKDNNTWYYYSYVTGNYQPIVLAPESLGYTIGANPPDPAIYSIWLETNLAGSPLALKIYYSGAWVDVYAAQLVLKAPLASPALTGTPTAPTAAPGTNTTQLATTAFVGAAIAAIPPPAASAAGQDIFKAIPSGNQDIVHGGAGTISTDVNFGTVSFDPDSSFGASIFTAPADGYYEFEGSLQMSVPVVGAATQVAGMPYFASSAGGNGAYFGSGPDTEEGTAQRFYAGSAKFYLLATQTVKIAIDTTVDAACTVRIGGLSFFSGQRCR